MFHISNALLMEALCKRLQTQFSDKVICRLSPGGLSIWVTPTELSDCIFQPTITKMVAFCIKYNLHFFIDFEKGHFTIYPAESSEFQIREQ